MTLQHKLQCCCSGIPELYTSILGSRDDPLAIMRDSYGENVILVGDVSVVILPK